MDPSNHLLFYVELMIVLSKMSQGCQHPLIPQKLFISTNFYTATLHSSEKNLAKIPSSEIQGFPPYIVKRMLKQTSSTFLELSSTPLLTFLGWTVQLEPGVAVRKRIHQQRCFLMSLPSSHANAFLFTYTGADVPSAWRQDSKTCSFVPPSSM